MLLAAAAAKITTAEVAGITAGIAVVTAGTSAGVQVWLGKRTNRIAVRQHEIDRVTAVFAEIQAEILRGRDSPGREIAMERLNSFAGAVDRWPPDMQAQYAAVLRISLRPVVAAGRQGGRYTVIGDVGRGERGER